MENTHQDIILVDIPFVNVLFTWLFLYYSSKTSLLIVRTLFVTFLALVIPFHFMFALWFSET